MRSLNVRRGVISGTILLLAAAATNGARSDTPLWAFVETMVVGLVLLALGSGVAIAINRRPPNLRW